MAIYGNSDSENEDAVRHGSVRRLRTLIDRKIRPPTALALTAVMNGHVELLPILKEAQSGLDESDGLGQTALGYAVTKGLADLASALLEMGADPDVTSSGLKPLEWAVVKENLDMVVLLLKHGANPNFESAGGRTPLFSAIRGGCAEIVRKLLDAGADPFHQGPTGMDSFALAQKEGGRKILQALRSATRTVSPTIRRPRNATELLIDAIKKGAKDKVERCLKKKINVNERHKIGFTALEVALEREDSWFAKRLLEVGADPNTVDADGYTPLDVAIRGGRRDLVKLLLDWGACVSPSQRVGTDPFLTACLHGEVAIATMLLQAGASPNGAAVKKPTTTPLMFAASKSAHLVEELLLRGAKVDAVDSQGYTALFHAVQTEMASISITHAPLGSTIMAAEPRYGVHDGDCGHIIRLLLKYSANVNHQDNQGRTALSYAVSQPTARMLIDAGARFDIVDKKGHDVQYWLKKNGLTHVAVDRRG
jgi:ankyrin repeat protein